MERRFGFHLSIAGSVANAPREAARSGYRAFQMFTTSSRSWRNSSIGEGDAREFAEIVGKNGLEAFAHNPYLCNPASADKATYARSREMLVNNVGNCGILRIRYLVVHLGWHKEGSRKDSIERICSAVSGAIDSDDKVTVLLENGAGHERSMGSSFGEIGEIVDRIGSVRVGLCVDTCHMFAAGYDIRDHDAVHAVEEEFREHIDPGIVKLIHLNDSKYGLGSTKDRHWHIGKGMIGVDGIRAVLGSDVFGRGPFVMELPDDEECGHDCDMKAALGAAGSG